MTLEEYRTRFVRSKIAYLELLEAPQLLATTPHIHDQLSVINNDLLQFAEDLTSEIRARQTLPSGRSEFTDSQLPGYQRLLLDANTLAQRVNASVRHTSRFFTPHPAIGR